MDATSRLHHGGPEAAQLKLVPHGLVLMQVGRKSPVPTKEDSLLARIARGDREAFVVFFEHVTPRLKTFFLQRGATPSLADELAQDVMIVVWRKAHQYDPKKGGAFTWLFVIARNRWIDTLRKERPTITYGIAPPEVASEEFGDASDSLETVEREETIREAMSTLPEDQREVVRRFFFSDQSHIDIAAGLGMPLGTVKSRLRLAMRKLRARLGRPQ